MLIAKKTYLYKKNLSVAVTYTLYLPGMSAPVKQVLSQFCVFRKENMPEVTVRHCLMTKINLLLSFLELSIDELIKIYLK